MTASSNKFKERNQVIEAYYRANKRKLVQKVSGRAGTPENAEDIVQNAFVNALQYWTPEVKDMDAWFGRILSSCLKRFMADDRRYGTTDEFNEELHDGLEMSQTNDDLHQKIHEAINNNRRSKVDVELLDLHFFKDYRLADLVATLDVTFDAARQTILRFKRELKATYGDVI